LLDASKHEIASLLQWSDTEVPIAILTDDDSLVHLVGTRVYENDLARAMVAQTERPFLTTAQGNALKEPTVKSWSTTTWSGRSD